MNESIQEIQGKHYKTGIPISVVSEKGKITSVKKIKSMPDLPYIGPGLVDLQINGHGGKDLNTHPLKENLVSDLTSLLWKEGVTSYLPTIITNHSESIQQALKAIASECLKNDLVNQSIIGIHLEGPFISPEEGARGAHKREFIRAPDWDEFQSWQEVADGRIKLITISPEWPNSISFIRKCVESGVIVSIGHTSATPEQIQEAVIAGASMSTHLGNGSHHYLPRHQNYIWEQLSEDQLWACIIADGFHLPKSVIKTFMRAKQHRVMLVSDAVYLSGMKPGKYNTFIGGKVILTPEGKLHMEDNENALAGSAQMLIHGIKYLIENNLATLDEAWDMSSRRPASFLGIQPAHDIQVGSHTDLVLFTYENHQINILQTYKNGHIVFEKNKQL